MYIFMQKIIFRLYLSNKQKISSCEIIFHSKKFDVFIIKKQNHNKTENFINDRKSS